MKKRIITLFLILLLLTAPMLIACGGNANTAEEVATAVPTENTLPDAGKFVVAVPKTSQQDYSIGNEVVKQKIIDSIASEKGVKIDFDVIELSAENFSSELNGLLATTAVDAILIDYSMLSTYTSVQGLIKPIDDLINSSGTNLYNAIDADYWEECKYNGSIYGVPSMPYPEESIMIARSDTLYAFTTEPVTEYTQLIALCKFYKTIGYEYPLAATWDQLFDIMATSFKVSPEPYTYDTSTKAFIMREQSSRYVEYYLEEMKMLYENGYIHPDVFTATEGEMKAEFLAGRSAIYIAEYSSLYDDRDALKSVFPNAEMQLITPITRRNNDRYISCEQMVDKVLVFTQSSANSEALMTYLDWAYTSQLNHTILELGSYGEQIMYNPAINQYEYIGGYSVDNIPYDGLYTLGLSTDLIYNKPTHTEYSFDIMAENTLQVDVQNYLTQTEHLFPVFMDLNDTAQVALDQYTSIMRTGAYEYITGNINIDEYAQYERNCRNSGLLNTLAQEIGVEYLYKLGVLE